MKLIKIFILLLTVIPVLGQENNPDLYLALQKRDYPLIIKICDDLLLTGNTGAEILKVKGIALQGMQDYENALASFIKASETDSTDATLDYFSSECLEQLGDLQGAISILENRHLSDSTDNYSVRNLARLYIKGRNFEKAFPFCMRLSETYPGNYIFSKNLATTAYQLGYFDIALSSFIEAWQLNRRDLTLPVSLANCYMKMKNPEKAIDILKEGLSYDSLNINILKTAGYLYFLGEDYNSAAGYFGKALSLGDSTEFVRKNLGISLFNENRFEESIPELMAFYIADTLNSEATYYLGLAMTSWHLKEEGIEYLMKTFDLISPDPTFMGAIYATTGQTRGDLNQYKQAVDEYITALRYDPVRSSYMFELAKMYEMIARKNSDADNYRNSISWFEKYLSFEEPRLEEIMKARNLDPDQIDSPGIKYAKERIKVIREELFFMGEIKN